MFIPIPEKDDTKECSNYRTIVLTSHASKVMLKMLQARLQQYVNQELTDVQLGLEKAEEPEIKLSAFVGSQRKKLGIPEKHLLLRHGHCKSLSLWITTNCGKFLKR